MSFGSNNCNHLIFENVETECSNMYIQLSVEKVKTDGFFKFCNHWSVENVVTGFFINDLEPVECQKC